MENPIKVDDLGDPKMDGLMENPIKSSILIGFSMK
jgi:hypothetical protein